MIPKLPSWIRAVCVLPELHKGGFGHQAFGGASVETVAVETVAVEES